MEQAKAAGIDISGLIGKIGIKTTDDATAAASATASAEMPKKGKGTS
jgi:hypothetical protein